MKFFLLVSIMGLCVYFVLLPDVADNKTETNTKNEKQDEMQITLTPHNLAEQKIVQPSPSPTVVDSTSINAGPYIERGFRINNETYFPSEDDTLITKQLIETSRSEYNTFSDEKLAILSESGDLLAKTAWAARLISAQPKKAFTLSVEAAAYGDALAAILAVEVCLSQNHPGIGYALLSDFSRQYDYDPLAKGYLEKLYLLAGLQNEMEIIEKAKRYQDVLRNPKRLQQAKKLLFPNNAE